MKDFIAKYITPTLISVLSVFAPIKSVLLVTGFLIMADLVSGIMAAKKKGEEITSAGIRRTLTKLLVYNLAIISGFLVQQYIVDDFLPMTKVIAGVISLVELKSILENLNIVNGQNIFKTVIEKLGSENDKKEGQ